MRNVRRQKVDAVVAIPRSSEYEVCVLLPMNLSERTSISSGLSHAISGRRCAEAVVASAESRAAASKAALPLLIVRRSRPEPYPALSAWRGASRPRHAFRDAAG